MYNSLKMTRLDYYTFKKQITVYAAFVLVILMLSATASSFIGLSITASWYVALVSTDIFAIQEKNELERLYAALSLKLENIISGRYIFIFMNYVFALMLSISIGIAVFVFQNTTVHYADIILSICVSLLLFTMIMGIQTPIYFRLGYTRARVWSMIPFISTMAIFTLVSFFDMFTGIITGLIKYKIIFEIACFVISFAILFLSYHLSVRCYRKRR